MGAVHFGVPTTPSKYVFQDESLIDRFWELGAQSFRPFVIYVADYEDIVLQRFRCVDVRPDSVGRHQSVQHVLPI